MPPTTITLLGPAENENGESRIGSPVGMDASKGKDVVLNDIQGGEHVSASGGKGNAHGSKGKHSTVAIAAENAAGDGFTKVRSLAPDDGNLKVNTITERERRRRMRDMFSTLHTLMSHVPKKADNVTLVGETIDYIRALEKTKIQLEKRKQEQELARQATTEARTPYSMLRTAQGMAAFCGWGRISSMCDI
ncbi:hypothetical protein BAE44_0025950 [Dichanthelium oligosanthes]|uniref:BHLH domain-containing protein n=1 Tax=Dichanthelium oligosanthes TaxID=888268 RepID=A0A1E5UJI7_9POAL|nr:hypothetical protein BAE44_0025950 [Dichanthelium oligosanthes]